METNNSTSAPYPIYELLDVFQKIDERISELHLNSSDAFLQLNSFLKEYFNKNNIVSANAVKIFDTISGDEEKSLIAEMNEIFTELQSYKLGTDAELNTNLKIYSQLISKIDSLSVQLRNYKQDFMTLKFIIANYKVIPKDEDQSKKLIELLQNFEQAISEIYPCLTGSSDEINSLGLLLSELKTNTKTYLKNSVNQSFGLYEELRSSITLINSKNTESKSHIPVLKQKITSSSNSIGNIIKHLQYHDIIKQKIEHIQKSHQKIISDIRNDAGNKDIAGGKYSEFITRVADISGLQAAQLILISKEYQRALEVISENFQKIADDLNIISTISHEFSYETEKSDVNLINLLKERLDKSLMIIDEYSSNLFNQTLLKIRTQINEINKLLHKNIFIPLETINNLVQIMEDFKCTNTDQGNQGLAIEKQLSSLTSEIIEKKNTLINEIAEIALIAEKFPVSANSDGFRSNLEKDQIRIMVNISRILGKLDGESKLLDNVLNQNYNIRLDIINRLKEVLDKADYYELFEKVLNKIIEQLNEINIQFKGNTTDTSGKLKNLKEIEGLYTVASERIVHQKVVNNDEAVILSVEPDNNDELELF